jgi:hypothetical protein
MDTNKRINQARLNYQHLFAQRAFQTECFGDHLARREGYKALSGMDAIHFYLIEKHHWLPAQVKALNAEDLMLLLEEEMHGWTVPPGIAALEPKRRKEHRN